MLTKLWEKSGESLAEQWILTVFSPAFVFWAGGVIAYALHKNVADILNSWAALSTVEQVSLIVGAFILVAFSAEAMERVQTGLLRLLEGYWPSWLSGVRFWLAERWYNKIDAKYKELDNLTNAVTPRDVARKTELDNELAHLPVKRSHSMPTLVGNLLSAAERYPEIRYGLDAVVCWPRLYPLLSDSLRQEIATARGKLDESTRLLAWSILFLVWTVWQWWALLGLVLAWLAYRGMIIAAAVYGDLICAAYDLYRFDLYKSLNWPLPEKPENEEVIGRQLTEYLFRGNVPPEFSFVHQKENGESKKG